MSSYSNSFRSLDSILCEVSTDIEATHVNIHIREAF